MTSEELKAIKKRLKELNDNCPIIDVKIWAVVRHLIAAVEEQQKELNFLRAVVHDMAEESDAIKEVVRLRKATLGLSMN